MIVAVVFMSLVATSPLVRKWTRADSEYPMRTLKTLAKTVLHDLGAIHGFRLMYGHGVRILMYHRFPRETEGLRQQCEIIRRNYSPVSLKSVSEYVRGGVPLPRNAVAITVDDGYRDFLLYGYPVFHEYDIPATAFVVSDFLDGKIWLWWDQLQYLFRYTQRTSLSLDLTPDESFTVSLATDDERWFARRDLGERLKVLENSQRLQVCRLLPELLGVELPSAPTGEWAPLKWDEVRELARNGVEFGVHTKTHPILSRIRDRAELREEIEGSKRRLEEELSAPAIHFCYPNGRRLDFNNATVELLKNCEFQTAVTTERGMNFGGVHPLLLRRLAVDASDPPRYFQELLAGVRRE